MPPLVSVITCACQQGDWVRKTIPKIRASLADWPHEILIVDDQSTDGCCHGLDKDTCIIRTDNRHGVSRSRRLGVSMAKGDIFLFTDPHCDYPGLALRDLVDAANTRGAICLPRTTGKPTVRRTRTGGELRESDRGLKIGYCYDQPARYPALLGSIYAVHRDIYEHLGGWPELPGVWGYSEQALSLMAWFSGVPIWVDMRHVCNHEDYHPGGHFSYSVPLRDQANNGHWVHASFFPETYESYWKPTLLKRYRNRPEYWSSLSEENGLVLERFRREIAKRSVRSEEQFFNMVLKKDWPTYVTDQEYIELQSTRSYPNMKLQSIYRRQDRALRWFATQVPGCFNGRKILDIGTRDGYVVQKLGEYGAKAEGVEFIKETAEWARETLGRNIKHGDVRKLDYPDNSWHCVTCVHVLEHVPTPREAIREIHRVLIPGGWMLLVVPKEHKPTRAAGHYVAFSTEEYFADMVLEVPFQKVTTKEWGLTPKPVSEFLLCAQKCK